jgi:uncharacterized membrane protein
VAIGLANFGSVEFFLRAVAVLPGPFVFPVNSISVLLGATLLGILVWRERPTPANVAGLVLAAVALLLLGRG